MRFDEFVAREQNLSRNIAKELIKSAKVKLNDKLISKPSLQINEFSENKIEICDEIYVSRAALKLKNFLNETKIDIKNKTCLDVGSSTGGFIEILLEFKASKVIGVDVGSGQIHNKISQNKKVEIYEKTDIRAFKTAEKFDIITCDISFISVNEILNILANLSKSYIIILFKPQFEVGKNAKRNKSGVVVDENAINKARINFEINAQKLGLEKEFTKQSKLKGKEGNVEYFYSFRKISS